ncbi:MAG: hypothetical protein LKH74_08735 [Levilactobacillus sp.]|jgi:hypothetical protein|uniref:Uncharacterized protein n=1 Tax=Levilactobacillus suantsaiihabitans TaxID=2487722 RepID=A0A4Z0JAP5_9LACO|nr:MULTISPECIES: hypothetical protein [Levilactobacillus]MCH4123899.1 hypothetical protein [Levilactobacillus sp.]MCI1553997.1 hypothetical protein [Levilactobacillus sp.]MCI1599661.1 hypothetical protein [Levilactobacillus sp.]MCI1606121.1 hypothetical protein [Levilactobacillus sp.]TGD18535.1 hypothetical protein EGT51_07740 [Levilactobacillus suantsaiihabitans]
MQQIIFLVTSLNGMHKPNFTQQLLQAVKQDVAVSVLVALVDFEATWKVRTFLNRLARKNPGVSDVNLVTLADLYRDEQGLKLTSGERNTPTLTTFDERLFADNEEQVKRYLDAGHLVAELRQLDDDSPMVLRQYHADQLVQIDTYGLDGQVVGIEKITDEVAQTSYVLNAKGEAVLRFVRHERPINHVFNLSNASAMMATEFADAKQNAALANMTKRQRNKAEAATVDHTSIVSAAETYYGVLAYSNYRRFDDLYTFYQAVLSHLLTPETRLYVDLAINAAISPQMPNQLIFNY